MSQTINILAPELGFGTFGMAKCQVEITEDGTPVSSRLYYFNINEFSAYIDSVNTNYGSIHFGQHPITLSNGTFTVVQYNGATKSSPNEAVYELAEAVAQLA